MTDSWIIGIIKVTICVNLIAFLFYRFIKEKQDLKDNVQFLRYRKSKLRFLIVFAIYSAVSFFNFGAFHHKKIDGKGYIHYPEFFVHYIGSKYFKELGYFDTYNAVVVADSEGADILGDNPRIMNLKTYHYIPKKEILENAQYYKSLFSPSRWKKFKLDIASLNRQSGPPLSFELAVADHGYHASPVWNATASILTNNISVDKIIYLSLLDVCLLILMFALLRFYFDLEIMLVALIFFSANFISSFYWIGGAFLRYDWLVASVCALALMHRNKYIPAGIFLSYAAMVRIFPVLFLAGPVAVAIWGIIRKRGLPRKYLQLFVSFMITSVILFAYGCTQGKGIENWENFAKKITFHNQTLLTNNVGFKVLFLADPSWSDFNKFKEVYGRTKENLFLVLSEVKRAELKQRNKELILFSLIFLFLFFLFVKNKDDVEAFAWGAFLIFMLLMPCNYYYSFLLMLAVILYRSRIDFRNTLCLSFLFVIQIFGHIIYLKDHFFLRVFYKISFLLFAYFLCCVLFDPNIVKSLKITKVKNL